jgi:hypothetical protein
MAQLNSDLLRFAAATTAAALTTSRKLLRNYAYYRNHSLKSETIYRKDLLLLCHKIRLDAFGLHNLLEDESYQHSPFLVSLAGEIHDTLEELHRKLLFFDADLIESVIPLIDSQRRFWNQFTDEQFYDFNLSLFLEVKMPKTINKLEKAIYSLPEHAGL